MNDKALGGDAGLAIIDDAGFDGGGGGFFEVGAGHDDEGIAAAEFQHNFLDALGGGNADLDAGLLAAGERGGGDTRIIEDAVHLRSADQKRLEHALGKAGAADDLFDFQSALRNVGRVLQQADIAGHQARRDEAEHLPERKVPGHDGEDDADGLIMDVTFCGGGGDGLVGNKTRRIFGIVAARGQRIFPLRQLRKGGSCPSRGSSAGRWLLFRIRGFPRLWSSSGRDRRKKFCGRCEMRRQLW